MGLKKMTYKGCRLRNGSCQVTRDGRKLDLRLDLFNHSPTGFDWGYGGSGPAQTALAILADFLKDDDRAIRLHQKLKWDVISRLPHGKWSISNKSLRTWLILRDNYVRTAK